MSAPPFCVKLVPEVRLFLQVDVGGLEVRILALLALLHVVVQREERGLGENNDHRDVDDDHQRLEEVGGIPRQTHADRRADEDDDARHQTEHKHERLARVALEDVLEAALAVIVVADQCREGKQAHGHGNEHRAEAAERGGHRLLHIGRALQLRRRLDAGGQAHQRRGRADQERVDKDAEHLDKTLLDGVGDVGRGRGVRGRAHTGLVGVQGRA